MFPTEYVMVILHYMKFLMLNITSVNGADIYQEEKTKAGALQDGKQAAGRQ